jgi:antitoxin HicB
MIEKSTVKLQSSGRESHTRNPLPPRNLEYYQKLDYPTELIRDEGAYVASNPDLPGCVSFGDTPNDAVENLKGVRDLWIEGQLKSGNSIPEPSSPDKYSGKFVLRIPKILHRMADNQARREGVSLNTYITSVLSGALTYSVHLQAPTAWSTARLEQWCLPAHGWIVGRAGENWQVRGMDPQYNLFLEIFSRTIGNPSVTKLDVCEKGEYGHAKAAFHVGY